MDLRNEIALAVTKCWVYSPPVMHPDPWYPYKAYRTRALRVADDLLWQFDIRGLKHPVDAPEEGPLSIEFPNATMTVIRNAEPEDKS
jgi:hypothetical protein